jgi:hypothetical protein
MWGKRSLQKTNLIEVKPRNSLNRYVLGSSPEIEKSDVLLARFYFLQIRATSLRLLAFK